MCSLHEHSLEASKGIAQHAAVTADKADDLHAIRQHALLLNQQRRPPHLLRMGHLQLWKVMRCWRMTPAHHHSLSAVHADIDASTLLQTTASACMWRSHCSGMT